MNVIVTGEKGLGLSYSSFKEIADLNPDLLKLRFSCLCGKYLSDEYKDIEYELPNHKGYCNVCKEVLEWRIKES